MDDFSGKYNLPETNSSHLKIDGWKMSFLLAKAYFQPVLLLVSGSTMDYGLTLSFAHMQTLIKDHPSDAWPTLVRPKVL